MRKSHVRRVYIMKMQTGCNGVETSSVRYRLIFLFWLIGNWLLMTGSAVAESAVDQLDAFLAATTTLSASFVQVSVDEFGKPGQRTTGHFYLSKPGRFRWDYEHPYRQEIVANGEKVWFYDADLEQVTVKRLGTAIGSTPALLLTGQVKLKNDFIIEEQGADEGMQWVKLTPRSEDSSFKYISIGVVGDQLRGMELSDNFGQLTRISFSDIRVNSPLDKVRFEFIPPSGVDVFEDF